SRFLDQLREARTHPGTTTVHVTHRLEEMGEMDRVLGLEAGRVVFDGTVRDLIARGAETLGVLPAAPARRAAGAVRPRATPNEPRLVEAQDIRWAVPGGAHPSREVLRGVNLAIRAGETVGIRGASGAGETTLAAILAALLEPSSGVVRWAPVSRD